MKINLKNVAMQSGWIFFTVLFSNVMVDLASDGNLHRIMSRPFLFFGGALLLSLIGGFIMSKISERTEKKRD